MTRSCTIGKRVRHRKRGRANACAAFAVIVGSGEFSRLRGRNRANRNSAMTTRPSAMPCQLLGSTESMSKSVSNCMGTEDAGGEGVAASPKWEMSQPSKAPIVAD